ncbi:helix-turn-helix domain-containing protein [Streptomyces decoyicus]|uniref:helix-turn-helix domain-containing protein n=1 Tax=Streptomyces decoyicus TaxID=249567 RepID=UPI00364FBDDD
MEIGPLLKAARTAHGLTQKGMADQLNAVSGWDTCTPNDVYRWETGRRKPAEWLPHLITVLGLDEAQAYLLASGSLPHAGNPTVDPQYHPEDDVNRRKVLSTGGAAALAALTPATLTAAAPTPSDNGCVDPQLIPHFFAQLDTYYASDMMLGAGALTGVVSEQYKLIKRLARCAGPSARPGLLTAASAHGALLGWLHQDAGMWDEAAYWHGLAQSDARMTGDADLIAYTLSHAGHLHADLGDGRSTVELCDAALSERGRLSARIQVTIKCQQAHGYALIGERRTADRLLDAASLAVEHVDPTVPWGSAAARNARYFEVQRATCYGRLGLHHEAVRIWEQINVTMPATARRDTGVFLARQATSYASTGEPEHAVALARQSSAIARETGSARHRQELGVLRAAMQPWATTRVGRELDQAIAA